MLEREKGEEKTIETGQMRKLRCAERNCPIRTPRAERMQKEKDEDGEDREG
jgi:hypothetical protein